MCCALPAVETDPGRCSAPRREAASLIAPGDGGRIVAVGEPIDRSPSDESSTKRRRGAGGACDAGTGVHRPDVPERVRASAAGGRGHGVVLPQGARQPGAVVGADGADDEPVRGGHEALRRRRRHRCRALRAARAQGRPDEGVPAALRRRRGRALRRRRAGEGAGAAHGAARGSGARAVPVAGLVHGDGQPLLRVRGGRRLRAVLPQVLLVLPVQREAVRQRPRVPQAAARQARRRLRGAGQRHRELRRPGADAAARRRAGRCGDRRPAAQVAGAAAAPVHGRRPGGGHPLRHLHAAGRVRPDAGLRPPRPGARLLRGGHPREPRPRPPRPRAVDLRPARHPTHPLAVPNPRHHRGRRALAARRLQALADRSRRAASGAFTRKGAPCAPRRWSTTPTTSMSASG